MIIMQIRVTYSFIRGMFESALEGAQSGQSHCSTLPGHIIEQNSTAVTNVITLSIRIMLDMINCYHCRKPQMPNPMMTARHTSRFSLGAQLKMRRSLFVLIKYNCRIGVKELFTEIKFLPPWTATLNPRDNCFPQLEVSYLEHRIILTD